MYTGQKYSGENASPTIDMKAKAQKRMKRIMQAMQETEQEVREENEYIV